MNLKEDLKNPIFAVLSKTADELGYECYVIGGFVRDIILKRSSNDIDVVVIGSGIAMAKEFTKRIGKKAHLSVFKNFGTAQVKLFNKGTDSEVEFVGARKESYRVDSRKPIVENGSLEDDQNRRDFTINALALCLNGDRFGDLIDPFNGLDAIKYRIIKTPLAPDITFSDDPLRMMRGIRFASQLNFMLEENTYNAIRKNKDRIKIVSGERIIDEINKIMASPKPSIGLMLMEKTGLMEIIFPEFHKLGGIEEREGRAHKDNLMHTLKVVDSVAAKSNDIWLRWAAALHDIAKPVTKKWDNEAGWTFHNHNYVGEKMIPGIFKRLKLPLNEHMKFVQKMVSLHMRPIALVEDTVTDSAVRRLLFDAGDDIDKLMLLCESDITSKNQDRVKKFLTNFKLVREKLKEIDEKDKIRNFQPPVRGEEIMKIFNLPPCHIVGDIKESIKNAIIEGEISNNYEEAYNFMMNKAKRMHLEVINPQPEKKKEEHKIENASSVKSNIYTQETKTEIVSEIISKKITRKEASTKLGCSYSTIERWLKTLAQ